MYAPAIRRSHVSRRRIAFLLVLGCALSAAPAAQAGAPGRWTQVTSGPKGSLLESVGLARTRDGVLHVAWVRADTPSQDTLLHTAIAPNGAVRAANPIFTWPSISPPALVAPGGTSLRVLWGAIGQTPGDPVNDLVTDTSDASGTAWSAPAGVNQSDLAYQSPIAATLDRSGQVWSTWDGTFGVRVRPGVAPLGALPPTFLHSGCCFYNSNVGADARSGEVWAAWDSNVTGDPGRFVQRAGPGGAPTGPRYRAPASATRYGGAPSYSMPSGRAAIAGRPGGQGRVWTAYPSGYPTTRRIVLWRIEAHRTLTAANLRAGYASGTLSLAADQDGRMWTSWVAQDRRGRLRLFARRSDRRVSKLGAIVAVPLPRGTTSAWRAASSAQNGKLDVLVNLTVGASPNAFTWHTQIRPPLSLRGVRARAGRGHVRVTFTATDAGARVPGATVRFRGRRAQTGHDGRASFTLARPSRPYRATGVASLGGYGGARATVTVR